jgi:DNA-binding helix-hairpin-helix protein with protein kinase domain
VATIGAGGYLIFNKRSRELRKSVANYLAWLGKAQSGVLQRARAVAYQQQQREEAFRRSKDELDDDLRSYRSEGSQLRKAILQQGDVQKNDFLRGFLVRDSYKKIPGMTASHVTMLESFGVESAYDIEQLKLYGIPNVDSELTMELLQWRAEVERGFVFDTEHSQTLAAMRVDEEVAARRFKITLARKILMGADRLDVLVDTRKAEMSRALVQYEDVAGEWTKVAKQLADLQNGRRPLERFANRGPAVTAAIAVGIPVLAFLLHLVFGQ